MDFSLINQTIQNFDGDSVVVFSNTDSNSNDAALQELIELNHFEFKGALPSQCDSHLATDRGGRTAGGRSFHC